MSDSLISVFKIFGRRKTAFQEPNDLKKMIRSLFIIDITCLGLSTTLGTGIFTILAHAAKHDTGPSVILSFLIAAVASCLGGLCYSELSSRFPEGGPSYVYLYATLGEIWAFLIGWSMIFEYTVACSLAAKSLSSYINLFTNGTFDNIFLIQTQSLHVLPGFEESALDLTSALLIISAGALLSLNLKLSCLINNILVFVCSMVIAGVVMIALSDMDPENWTAGPGFFPNGVNGIFSAASLCFFAFHGYDIIASVAGETQHRIRIVPVGISLAFLLGLVACFSASVAITLLIPYSLMDDNASIIQAFTIRGYEGTKYLIIIGATSGLYASIIATLIGLSRLIFSMSCDGLLPRPFSRSNFETGTTRLATVTSLLLSSTVALTVQSSTLFLWLGMGTLLSYMGVSIAILALRYGLQERLPLEASELVHSDSVALSLSLPENVPSMLKYICETCDSQRPSQHRQCKNEMLTLSSKPSIDERSPSTNFSQSTDTSKFTLIPSLLSSTSLNSQSQLLPNSIRDCLLTRRAFNCDTNKCELCTGRPCLKPNKTFIKGARMYGTMDKPKPMTVNLLSDNTFNTSILSLESSSSSSPSSSLLPSTPSSLSSSSPINSSSYVNGIEDKSTDTTDKDNLKLPTEKSFQKVTVLLTMTIILMVFMGTLTVHITSYLPSNGTDDWLIELIVTSLFIVIIGLVIGIIRQPKHGPNSRNSIPCVPLLPICAIWMDVHLIICLPSSSWISFVIWSLIGIFVYMSYSVWHSHESDDINEEDLRELNINVLIDEDNDEIIHCFEDITDGSSV